ncbi:MAG TPA: autotransporter-associated beta strand repeat-containing protein, partial [Planctomycetota bacterium]
MSNVALGSARFCLAALLLLPLQVLAATALGTNVPEAGAYTLVYQKDIPVNSPGWNGIAVPYEINNSAVIKAFDRIAYYWELQKPAGGSDWVYVSVDAFTTDKNKIGIPNTTSGAFFQQILSNMNVWSNVAGIVTGTGITTGNIEFWPSNFGGNTTALIPTGSNVFDWNDSGANMSNGHGSMQIHNYGANGTGQVLFAYNAWGAARTSELGIGSQPGGAGTNLDWVGNTANISTYSSRTLQVLVRQIAPVAPQLAPAALVANAPELAGYRLVYQKNIPNAVIYNGTTIVYDQDYSNDIAVGSFDRVAYYLQLDGNWVEVSFDAAGFTNDAKKTGIPNTNSGEFYQQNVANMNVASNVAGIATGSALTGGNLEFWPSDYNQANAVGVPNANAGAFDFGDGGAGMGSGYGSMQIHNHFVTPLTGQTIFAYNRWGNGGGGGNGDLGIGTQGAGNPDWTFAQNTAAYTTKTLYVLVRPLAVASGTNGDDTIVVSKVGPNYQYVVNAGAPVPFSGTATLEIYALDGNDTVILDFSGGNPIPTGGLNFSGGNPLTAPGDKFVIANATGANAITNLAHTSYSVRDGQFVIDGLTANYFGVETIGMSGCTVANLTLNLTAGIFDQAVLEDDATAGNGISQLRSLNASFCTLPFVNPSASLTINGNGSDTISIVGLDSTFATPSLVFGSFLSATNNTFSPAAANSIPLTPTLTVTGLATLDLNGFNVTIGALAGDGAVALGASTLTTGANNTNSTFSGTITGTGSVAKSGSGTWTPTGTASTYSGGTTFLQGAILASSVANFGAGGLSFSGGTLRFASAFDISSRTVTFLPGGAFFDTNGNNVTFGSGVGNNGPGGFTKIGAGTLALSGASQYGGSTQVLVGTLQLGGLPPGAAAIYTFDNVAGATVNNDGSLGAAKNATINNTVTGTIAPGGHRGNALFLADATAHLRVALTAGRGLDLAGGSWTASIWYRNLQPAGSGGWRTLYHGNSNDDYQTIVNDGSRHLYSLWGGNQDSGYVMPAGDTGWHMITTVGSPGSTQFYLDGAYISATTWASTSDIYSIGARQDSQQLWASRLDDLYFYQRALSAAEVAALYVASQGTGGNALPITSPVLVDTGATLQILGGGNIIGPLSGPAGGSVNITSGSLTVNSTVNSTYSGIISGAGNLGKSGVANLTLAAANTYTGSTTVSGGTLVKGNLSAVPSTALVVGGAGATFNLNGFAQQVSTLSDASVNTGTITNTGAPTTFSVNNGATCTFSGTFTGALTLNKDGASTLVLSGHNTYTGATNINSGILQLPDLGVQQPLALTGWNQDIIVGATEGAPGYSTGMVGWDFYEIGYPGSTQGLPADSGATPRTVVSTYNANVKFQFAPYAGNNAIYLDGPGNATLTLATPARFQALQFLETTRTMNWYAKLNFADGSTTTTATWNDPDWTSNPGPADRCLTNYGLLATAGGFYAGYLWMADREIALSAADQAKVLNSITIYTTSAAGNQLALFAVSGKTVVTSVTDVLPDTSTVTVASGATLNLAGSSETIGPLAGPAGSAVLLGSGSITINSTDGVGPVNTTFAGQITGGGGLAKLAGGILTLSGSNAYGGSTTINAGTIRLGPPSGGATGVFANVPEAANYSLVYELHIGTGCNYAAGVPYSIDNSAAIPTGSFSRVGYYLELQPTVGPFQYVYTSFDAAPFSTNASKLGVPNATSGILYHYDASGVLPGQVRNMNVFSNVPAAVGVNRTGVTTGNVEFWATNYTQTNAYNVPNANGGTFDFGDQDTPGAYGSMQIHDYGTQQVLFAFNNWNGGGGELGIGADPNLARVNYNPDWTFTGNNLANYTVRNLQVVVDARIGTGIPATSPLVIAPGASLDLAGCTTTVGSLADGFGGGGTVVNSDPARPAMFALNPASGSTSFSGVISDNGAANAVSLVKKGAGTQVLSGANAFTGTTAIQNGTLALGADNTLPAATATTLGNLATSGVLELNGHSQTLGGLTTSGSGNVNKVIDSNSASSANALTLNMAGNGTIVSVLGDTTNNTFSIVKNGVGTLTIGGTNTYTGTTTILGGTIKLQGGLPPGAKVMPLGDSITYGSGGTNAGYRYALYSLLSGGGANFQFVGSYNQNPGSLPTAPIDETYHEGHGGWVTGDVGTGILHGVKTAASGGLGWLAVNPDLILLHIGTNNTGGSEPQSILDVGNILDEIKNQRPTATTYVCQIIPKNGATAWVTQYNLDLVNLIATKRAAGYNVGLVDMNTTYPLPLATTLPDGVHPNDTGYTYMAQQYYNAIVAGGLFGGSNVLPSSTSVFIAGGGNLDLNGISQTVAVLTDFGGAGGHVGNSAASVPSTLTLNGGAGTITYSGTITDAVSLVKNDPSTFVLAGANSYTGTTTFSDGTLQVGAGGTTGTLGTGNTIINNNRALVFNHVAPAVISYSGAISGAGSLVKNGTGTLVLGNSSSYTGATNINAGTLRLQNPAPAPVGGTEFWLDASAATTLSVSGGKVNQWTDRTSNGINAGQGTAASQPTLLYGALNGLPVVDFAAPGSGLWMQLNANITDIRSVFWVLKGGSFLLGSTGAYDFHRGGPGNGTGVTDKLWEGAPNNWTSGNIRGGQTYLNGTLVDGTATALPAAYSIVDVITAGNVQANALCNDRGIAARIGGQQIAEIVIYNSALTDAQRRQNELYLACKWFGILPTTTPVRLLAGATLDVNG